MESIEAHSLSNSKEEMQAEGLCINDVLTDDELRAILWRITEGRDKDTFGIVCKRWLTVQSSERRRLCARAAPLMLQRVARRFTRLQHLDFSQSASRSFFPGVSDDDLVTIASSFSTLRYLALRDCKGITDTGLKALGKGLPRLCSLDVAQCKKITNIGIQAISEGCTDLIDLRIEGCRSVTDASLEHLAKNCKKLEELHCQGCINITDIGLSHLAQGCHSLKVLDVSKCVKIGDNGLTKVFEACRHLMVLKVSDCMKVGNKAIFSLAKECLELEVLMIGGCKLVTGDSIHFLVSVNGTSLQNLQLEWCQQILNDSVVSVLTCCSKLEYLNLACCDKITDEAFSCLTNGGYGSCLKHLNISNCLGVSVLGISLVSQFCHSLEFLDVRNCPQVTKESLEQAGIHFNDKCKLLYQGSLSDGTF